MRPAQLPCSARRIPEMAYNGSRSLLLDFDVTPNAWATCALFYENLQDWSASEGLSFYLHASQAGLVFNVDIYTGSPDAQETYSYTIESPPESVDGWVPYSFYWSDFQRVDWEENAGEAFSKPEQILGMAFGFSTYEDAPNTGRLWVDDLALIGQGEPVEAAPAAVEPAADVEQPDQEQPSRGFSLPCGSGFLLPALLITFGLYKRENDLRVLILINAATAAFFMFQ